MKKLLLVLGVVLSLAACSSTKTAEPKEEMVTDAVVTETAVVVEQPEQAPVVKKVIIDK